MRMSVAIKRVYEARVPAATERASWSTVSGRAASPKRARSCDEWLRDLAPSDELRRWYHAQPEHWQAFRKNI